MKTCLAAWLTVAVILPHVACAAPPESAAKTLHVKRTDDFKITGDGSAATWQNVPWLPLSRREDKGHAYKAQVKMLYSDAGLYVLFSGTDRTLTATKQEDYLDLWTEDVFEFFLWTDQRQPIYFEYEISPLGYELPILVPNIDGEFLGWRPWQYDGERKIHKATTTSGGEKESGAAITGWTAEVFLPYAVLKPLGNVPPKPGTRWRGNFYRVDYDDGQSTSWDWARVGPSFHEFEKYGTLLFD